MSKVITGNGEFYGCLSEPPVVSAWWKETTQTRAFVLSVLNLLLSQLKPQLSKTPTLTTHVRFYTFMEQPLSKQLYAD